MSATVTAQAHPQRLPGRLPLFLPLALSLALHLLFFFNGYLRGLFDPITRQPPASQITIDVRLITPPPTTAPPTPAARPAPASKKTPPQTTAPTPEKPTPPATTPPAENPDPPAGPSHNARQLEPPRGPIYPSAAIEQQLESCVLAAIDIDEEGQVSAVTILDAEIPEIFDEAVRDSQFSARYLPARSNGRNIPSRVLAVAEFTLDPGQPRRCALHYAPQARRLAGGT